MMCNYCKGNPPNRIHLYRDFKGTRHMDIPLRYKKCDHCEVIGLSNDDQFYNSHISIVCAKFYRKIIDAKNP